MRPAAVEGTFGGYQQAEAVHTDVGAPQRIQVSVIHEQRGVDFHGHAAMPGGRADGRLGRPLPLLGISAIPETNLGAGERRE